MPKVAKARSRIALFATLAVVASLFVALPASAATGDVEKPATYSACVGAATADAGFGDTAGSFAKAAIDCIAHYKITLGTATGVYSPGAAVTREQMALFLIRAAGPAGITVPAAASQGFTDIGNLPQASQDAINQLAALGVSKGTSTTTYSPGDAVSRYQMALFLVRFLAKAGVTFDGTSGSGFTDTGAVSFEAYNAIEDAYDLGVTTGTTTTSFSPFAAVTREQMAAFIGRTLSQTNARPAGLAIQADKTSGFGDVNPKVQISYRDASFMPVANVLIDLFSKTVDTGTTLSAPLKADGTCDGTQTGDCTISLTDPVTNVSGNIDLTPNVASGKTTQWWAWTGDSGDKFDLDIVTPASVTVTSTAGAASTVISWNLPENALVASNRTTAKFGTVTYTFQLNSKADGTGSDVAQSGQTITYDYTLTTASGSESKTGQTVKTDATGAATISFSVSDPNAATGDSATLDITISGPGAEVYDMNDEDVAMTDAAAAVSSATIKSAAKYVVLSGVGGTGSNSVTVTVYDQYGAVKTGESVTIDSDQASSSLQSLTRSAGSVTQGYTWSGAAVTEKITIDVASFGGADDGSVTVVWADPVTADVATGAAVPIQIVDTDNDTIVAGNKAWKYDANDQFNLTTGAVSLADFETALKAGGANNDDVEVTYKASATGISVWDLS